MASVEKNLISAIRECAYLRGQFTLRSGKTSNTYLDKYQFEANPHLLCAIAWAMEPLISPYTEVLAGLEMGGIPIVTMLSQVTGIPAAFIRKEPKAYGTCRYAEGASLVGRKFVIIEDVVSTGGAIVDSLAKLKADNLYPTEILCVIDRESGGKETLLSLGFELAALFTISQIEQ